MTTKNQRGARGPRIARVCRCGDRGCSAHKGIGSCDAPASTVLYRVDMIDRTGTDFCAACAEDADASTLYSDRPSDGGGAR